MSALAKLSIGSIDPQMKDKLILIVWCVYLNIHVCVYSIRTD